MYTDMSPNMWALNKKEYDRHEDFNVIIHGSNAQIRHGYPTSGRMAMYTDGQSTWWSHISTKHTAILVDMILKGEPEGTTC